MMLFFCYQKKFSLSKNFPFFSCPCLLVLDFVCLSLEEFFFPFLFLCYRFSIPNSIPIFWLYILIACIRVSNSSSFFANSLCRPYTLSGWFFSWCPCTFSKYVTEWHHRNSNTESLSPWNITLWIFTSIKVFLLAVKSTPSFSWLPWLTL